jgi:phosphoglycerol transferase MdoB-like AlkP superfamily enzyme
MGMADYTMDADLMSAIIFFTEEKPFFLFHYHFSGHGPYDMSASASKAHLSEAKALAPGESENYVHAVAHAMETDRFIGALVEKLESDGLMDDTVLSLRRPLQLLHAERRPGYGDKGRGKSSDAPAHGLFRLQRG